MNKLLGFAVRTAAMLMMSAIAVTGITSTAYAANGDDGLFVYDFEDYDAAYGQGTGPDEYMGIPEVYENGKESFPGYKNFGPDTDPETGSKVMKMTAAAFPSIIFPEALTEGKLIISFDMKIDDPEDKNQVSVWLYGGTDELTRYADETHLMTFNGSLAGGKDGKTVNYAKTSGNWVDKNELKDFTYADSKQWNHYEFRITNLGLSSALLDGYINGKPMFTGTKLSSHNARYLRALGLFKQGSGTVYVDNFYAKHYVEETAFIAEAYDQKNLSLTDRVIKAAMTERSTEPVTADNISITNVTAGQEISDFEVNNYTGKTFDIVINEEIDYGQYKVEFNNVTGEISKSALSKAIVIDTEYKTAVIENKQTLDFNDYTDTDGTLPEGFFGTAQDFAKGVNGKTADEDDYALGFSGTTGRSVKRAMYKFDTAVECNGPIEFSFDAYVGNARLYFYIADEEDFLPGNENAPNAVILLDEDGKLYYANDRATKPTNEVDSDLVLTPSEWHNIKVRIVPEWDEDKTYLVISADDGEEYTFETSRPFHQGAVSGLGVGYYNSSSADADVRVDNISTVGTLTTVYPQVDNIGCYDSFGNKVIAGSNTSAMVSEVRIDFNTYISHNLDGLITITEDGAQIPVSYEVFDDDSTRTSMLVITFESFLNPLREYSIGIAEGIPSIYSGEAASFIGYTYDIIANNEVGFKCELTEYDEDSKTASVVFSKNSNDEGSFLYALAGYKKVTVTNNDGEPEEMLVMTGIEYIPITFSSKDVGRFEYKLKYNGTEGEEYKTFLWKYPKMEKVEFESDGTIK